MKSPWIVLVLVISTITVSAQNTPSAFDGRRADVGHEVATGVPVDYAARCPGADAFRGAAAPASITSSNLSEVDLAQLSRSMVTGGVTLARALRSGDDATAPEAFEAKSRISIVSNGVEFEAYSLLNVQEHDFEGVLIFSPVPRIVRAELAARNIDVPWSVMTIAPGSATGSIRLGLVGHGPAEDYALFDEGSPPSAASGVQTDVSDGCVDCIKGQLINAACEAVAVAISCKTVVGCPGAIMAAVIKSVIGDVCSQFSLVACAAQCAIPTISLTPGSNTTFPPSNVQVQVSVSGVQSGNWVAILRGTALVYLRTGFGSSDTYSWPATQGTYRIMAGNIPLLASMPWYKSSSNVVIASANAPPTANFVFTTSGLTANFEDRSTDSDGSIASREWNFGDGTTSTSRNPSRTFASAGSKSVSLRVTDNGGKSHSTTKTVTVEQWSSCSGSVYTGSLNQGSGAVQPGGGYYTTTRSGAHTGRLEGPLGTDFDLFLYRWNGAAWVVAASGSTGSNNEVVSYNGAAGSYYWLVSAYRGSGSYRLCISRP